MPAPKPTVVPRWATAGVRTEPAEAKKDTGWVVAEKPAAQNMNWQQGLTGDWLAYLNDLAAQSFAWTAAHSFAAPVTTTADVTVGGHLETATFAALQGATFPGDATVDEDGFHLRAGQGLHTELSTRVGIISAESMVLSNFTPGLYGNPFFYHRDVTAEAVAKGRLIADAARYTLTAVRVVGTRSSGGPSVTMTIRLERITVAPGGSVTVTNVLTAPDHAVALGDGNFDIVLPLVASAPLRTKENPGDYFVVSLHLPAHVDAGYHPVTPHHVHYTYTTMTLVQ